MEQKKYNDEAGYYAAIFFPYLGYWQLMNTVDEFILYDDVTFIKNGWISRNRIKSAGKPLYFGLQVRGISSNRRICDHELLRDERSERKLRRTLENVYHRAPYYEETASLFGLCMDYPETNLALFLNNCIRETAAHLGIKTRIISAAEQEFPHETSGQDRILELCSLRKADAYYNSVGGKSLYDQAAFAAAGCPISFLRMDENIRYAQGEGAFVPALSILDALMYNSRSEMQDLLMRYSLE